MKEVYILKSDLNEWIAKYFHKDLISISELLGCIEDLDWKIEDLKEQLKKYEEPSEDWQEIEYDEPPRN